MSFFKKLFRKKTPEELKAELEALVEAQKRDNERIREWFTFRSPETEEEALAVRRFWKQVEKEEKDFSPMYSHYPGNAFYDVWDN